MERVCHHCGAPLDHKSSGAWYCSTAHRIRAFRRRRAGIAENAYSGPRGAARGPVPLGQPTEAESLIRLRLDYGISTLKHRALK